MHNGDGAVSFDFLGGFWNITSHPTSHAHASSGGIITLRRYQTVSIEAAPLALSLPSAARHLD